MYDIMIKGNNEKEDVLIKTIYSDLVPRVNETIELVDDFNEKEQQNFIVTEVKYRLHFLSYQAIFEECIYVYVIKD